MTHIQTDTVNRNVYPAAGDLGDACDLSARARRYANAVVFGEEWPLAPEHVDIDGVTFETSTRMERKHGVCVGGTEGRCTVRLSQKTADRAGFSAIEETVRHELVHVLQFQTDGLEMGHGPSFRRWVDPLELSGRCSEHYTDAPADYAYTFHCPNCGFVGGRYRMCKTVRAGLDGGLRCGDCESSEIEIRDGGGKPIEIAES